MMQDRAIRLTRRAESIWARWLVYQFSCLCVCFGLVCRVRRHRSISTGAERAPGFSGSRRKLHGTDLESPRDSTLAPAVLRLLHVDGNDCCAGVGDRSRCDAHSSHRIRRSVGRRGRASWRSASSPFRLAPCRLTTRPGATGTTARGTTASITPPVIPIRKRLRRLPRG